MTTNDVLIDGFGRIKEIVHSSVDNLGEEQLAQRPGRDANSIAWLVWHLARVQDSQLAELMGSEQRWTGAGWAEKFNLPLADNMTGYGHTTDEAALVRASASNLLGYYDEVHDATIRYIRKLKAADYEQVVDDSWDPPVTLAVRLISVLSDDLQHAGQAAYVRGLIA